MYFVFGSKKTEDFHSPVLAAAVPDFFPEPDLVPSVGEPLAAPLLSILYTLPSGFVAAYNTPLLSTTSACTCSSCGWKMATGCAPAEIRYTRAGAPVAA